MKRLLAILALFAIWAASPALAAQDPPRVLASIKPIHSLAAAVMEGVGQPELLLSGAASPHSYSLKPSDAGKIAHADVIFWVGPALENFLATPLANIAPHARKVALIDAPGLTRLPARRGGVWEADPDEPGAMTDGHIWLDPQNGIATAREMARVLAAADPAHAPRYAANAEALAVRLGALDRRLGAELKPIAGKPYILFHDAFHYFENRYRLTPAGAVTVASERPPGTRRVAELRARIAGARVLCVFTTPQFPPPLVRALVAGTAAKTAPLDDLGADIAPGPALYETLLTRIADSMTACLR